MFFYVQNYFVYKNAAAMTLNNLPWLGEDGRTCKKSDPTVLRLQRPQGVKRKQWSDVLMNATMEPVKDGTVLSRFVA